MRTVVGRIHDEGVVGDAQLIEIVERLANILVVIDHDVLIFRLPSSGLAEGSSEILVSWKSGSSIFLVSGRYPP